MKLISEYITEPLSILTEGKGTEKTTYIAGPFAVAEQVNKNGRIYPQRVLESAVDRYNQDYVKTKRALGEMNHPPRLNVDFERATHLITELNWDKNVCYGKAKVLSTPMGKILEGLINSGVAVGVSTRGAGSIKESAGAKYVNDDFQLTAVDVVSDPSGPGCFVEGIMEGVEFVFVDGKFVEEDIEKTRKLIESTSLRNLQEAKVQAFQNFLKKISS